MPSAPPELRIELRQAPFNERAPPIRHVPAESKNLHTKKDPKLQAKSLI
jgi:hypothetical protein